LEKIQPNKGVISIKKYVPGKSTDEVIRELNIANPLKMASNENPFGISPKAGKSIKKHIKKSFQYPEVSCPDLREKLSKYINIDKDNIVLCNGADSVIYNIGMCLLNREDEVIIPEITFPMYETIARSMNCRIVESEMSGFGINLKDIISKITEKTKIIWICNPNNPTGTLINKTEFNNFINKVPGNIMIVHDEVYYDFADINQFPDTVNLIKSGMKNIFVIRSFSKVYGLAGVRLGYGIGSKDIIDLLYRVRIPFDVSVLAQAAGIGAIDDKDFYNKTVELNKRERNYIYSELESIGIKYLKTNTNFILIDLEKDADECVKKLLYKGIIVRPMKNYNLPNFFRLTIGRKRHNKRFLKALKELL
jgi:histidinol-phosphate aminotransferase